MTLSKRVAVGTVLVVEDADGLRALVARVLQRQGYTVLVAADAQEAVRLFEQSPSIDVVLTDLEMPGGSGQGLAAELVERNPALKVVYMSGVHHAGLEPGGVFLQKPFTAGALGEKIREALGR